MTNLPSLNVMGHRRLNAGINVAQGYQRTKFDVRLGQKRTASGSKLFRFESPTLSTTLRPVGGVPLRRDCTNRRSQAARLDKKYPSAFFPSLAAFAMLSKKTGERFTGADLPAQ